MNKDVSQRIKQALKANLMHFSQEDVVLKDVKMLCQDPFFMAFLHFVGHREIDDCLQIFF